MGNYNVLKILYTYFNYLSITIIYKKSLSLLLNLTKYYHAAAYNCYKIAWCIQGYTFGLGEILADYIYLLNTCGANYTFSRNVLLIGHALRQPVFFSSFYLKIQKLDSADQLRFAERGVILHDPATLRAARNITQKYYKRIYMYFKRSSTTTVHPIVTEQFVFFSTKFNNLFFLRMQQYFIALFLNNRLPRSLSIHNYIMSKKNNNIYTRAYNQLSPIKTFLTHCRLMHDRFVGFKNHSNIIFYALSKRCNIAYGRYKREYEIIYKNKKKFYFERLLGNPVFQSGYIVANRILPRRLYSWRRFSVSNFREYSVRGGYTQGVYKRYINLLAYSRLRFYADSSRGRAVSQPSNYSNVFVSNHLNGYAGAKTLSRGGHLKKIVISHFKKYTTTANIIYARGRLHTATRIGCLHFLVFNKMRTIFKYSGAASLHCLVSYFLTTAVNFYKHQLHYLQYSHTSLFLATLLKLTKALRRITAHNYIQVVPLLQYSFKLLMQLNRCSRVVLRLCLKKKKISNWKNLLVKRLVLQAQIKAYIQNRQIFKFLNIVNTKFVEARVFFFKRCYSGLNNNIQLSSTIFYYFLQYNMFNKNIFKYTINLLKSMVRPFFFTRQHRNLSKIDIAAGDSVISRHRYAKTSHAGKSFFLANLATGFEYITRTPVRLIKLAGHYLPMWRRLRQSFREARVLRNIWRQHRLTRYIARLCRDARFWTLQMTELMLFFILVRSKVIQLKYISFLFIQSGFAYINGCVCTLPTFNVQGGDIIQVVYSYETFLYNSILQQEYLQQFLQHIFYFIVPYTRPRTAQHNRLSREYWQHRQYLRELRAKRGRSVGTRFSLMGEFTHLYKFERRHVNLRRANRSWWALYNNATKPISTFMRRLYFLRQANQFIRCDRRVVLQNTMHPYNVRQVGIAPANKIQSFFKFNVQRIFDITLFFSDIPPYMEVDFLSLSIVILYLPTSMNELHKTSVFFSGYGLGKMLNWKYIT